VGSQRLASGFGAGFAFASVGGIGEILADRAVYFTIHIQVVADDQFCAGRSRTFQDGILEWDELIVHS